MARDGRIITIAQLIVLRVAQLLASEDQNDEVVRLFKSAGLGEPPMLWSHATRRQNIDRMTIDEMLEGAPDLKKLLARVDKLEQEVERVKNDATRKIFELTEPASFARAEEAEARVVELEAMLRACASSMLSTGVGSRVGRDLAVDVLNLLGEGAT
jgi:tetrahydromethanopterin S-methyltransferase subunit G